MREFILNDACLGAPIPLADVAALAVELENGLVALIGTGHGVQRMRLASSTGEIEVAVGITLAELLTHLLRTTSSGRVLARMATKFPVEDDVDDGEFEALVHWAIPAHPDSLSLVLCAHSRRIAATMSAAPLWAVDPLVIDIATDPAAPGAVISFEIDNVYSAENAGNLASRLTKAFVASASPAEIWADRAGLYPYLDFAPRVEKDLASLGRPQYAQALQRLGELNSASGAWAASAGPPAYLSRVTGESKPTMDKYGSERRFRSCDGSEQTFELHARLTGGFRVHLREVLPSRRLEIGYIGPHLSIVSEN